MSHSDLTITDCETLGLHPHAPIWEFAAIRRSYNDDGSYSEREFHCFIKHRAWPWLQRLPERFRTDYLNRYRSAEALHHSDALSLIVEATDGAHIVGAVPNFDTERLDRLIRRRRLMNLFRGGGEPSWHYHLVDVENQIVGYLQALRNDHPTLDSSEITQLTTPPWYSNDLSRAVGVNPDDFNRHTAMGDVRWARALYDAVNGAMLRH